MKKFEVIESKAILPPERYLFFIELPLTVPTVEKYPLGF